MFRITIKGLGMDNETFERLCKLNDRKVRSKWKHQILFLLNSGELNLSQHWSAINKLQIIEYINSTEAKLNTTIRGGYVQA